MLACILRFIKNSRKIEKVQFSDLSYWKLKMLNSTYQVNQKDSFTGVNDVKIRNLRPFCDGTGILRVKTKVSYRQDTMDFRYPIILPSDHPVVHLLIKHKHNELLHAGVSLLMTHLRDKFWIIKTRKTIRSVVQQCVCCKRFNTKSCKTEPVSLPQDRVQDAAIFQVVGVDLAGPLYLKDGRFIARRGRPWTIYSDNGSNFVGANSFLSNIDWNLISSTVAVQRINWKFNPPTASWFGGFWERIVQMI